MKKIILAVFLVAGAVSLNAAALNTGSPFQQDTSMHKKMHKKSGSDTGWHKKGGKMKKDSMK